MKHVFDTILLTYSQKPPLMHFFHAEKMHQWTDDLFLWLNKHSKSCIFKLWLIQSSSNPIVDVLLKQPTNAVAYHTYLLRKQTKWHISINLRLRVATSWILFLSLGVLYSFDLSLLLILAISYPRGHKFNNARVKNNTMDIISCFLISISDVFICQVLEGQEANSVFRRNTNHKPNALLRQISLQWILDFDLFFITTEQMSKVRFSHEICPLGHDNYWPQP